MATGWRCAKCHAFNLPVREHCKSCLHEPTNVLSLCLKSIEEKQDLLFHGYIRLKISNNNKPTDIINLSFKFYFLNIKLPNANSTTTQQLDILWKMAKKFCLNKENFIGFNIFDFIKHNFNDGYCEYKMAEILNEWKEYHQSESFYKQAMAADNPTPLLKVKYIYKYGLSLYNQGKYKLAQSQLQSVCQESERQSDNKMIKKILYKSMRSLAACYKNLNEFDHAAIIYDKLIKLVPDDMETKYLYSGVLRRLKKHEQALRNAMQISEQCNVSKRLGKYAIEVARCYEGMKKYQLADEYYLRAIKLDDSKKEKYYRLYAQFLHDHIKDYEKAKTYFIKATELNPGKCSYVLHIAECYEGLDEFENAKKYYLMAIGNDPYGAKALFRYALFCRDKLKDYGEADIHFKKARETHRLVYKATRKSMKPLQTDIDQDRGNIEIASSPSPDETTTLNPAEMSDHDLL